MKKPITLSFIFGLPLLIILIVAISPFFSEGIILVDELHRRWEEDGVYKEAKLPDSGGLVRKGDTIFLNVMGREPLYVYVFKVSTAGKELTLFPDSRIKSRNPLSPDVLHRLPDLNETVSWTVNSNNEDQIFFVYTSQKPIVEAKYLVKKLPCIGSEIPFAAPVPASESSRQAFKSVQRNMMLHKKLKKQQGVWARRFVVKQERE